MSKTAYKYLGIKWDGYGYVYNEDRTNPKLVNAVEKLGAKANGRHANLKVVEIPDDVKWEVEDYDGMEIISEIHREWW